VSGSVIDGVAIAGGVKYAVHVMGGNWLPAVTGYDIYDSDYGYAGVLGKAIDAVMINGRSYATSYNSNNGSSNSGSWDGTYYEDSVSYSNDSALGGYSSDPGNWDCKHHKVCKNALNEVGSRNWAKGTTRQAKNNPSVIVIGDITANIGLFDETEVTLRDGDWKCNLFIYEMLLDSGIDIGTPRNIYKVLDGPPTAQDWYAFKSEINGEDSKLREYFELVAEIKDKSDRTKVPFNSEYEYATDYLYDKTRPGDIVTNGEHLGIVSKYFFDSYVNTNSDGDIELCINTRESYVGHTAFGFRASDKPVRFYRLKEKYLKEVLL